MDENKLKEKMDEVKSKAKDLMKRFSNPFGSSRSSTFKGEGHRLGGPADCTSRSIGEDAAASNSSCSRGTGGMCGSRKQWGPGAGVMQQQGDWRKLQQEKWERERGVPTPSSQYCAAPKTVNTTLASAAASVKSPSPDDSVRVDTGESRGTVQVHHNAPPMMSQNSHHGSTTHFDPTSPTFSSRPSSGVVKGRVQCPVCEKWWQSEAEVSAHIDDCTGLRELSIAGENEREQVGNDEEDLDDAVAFFLSGGPSTITVEVIVRLLRNIINDPGAEKYRKIRLGNQKIKETIGSAIGGVKFLQSVGFRLSMEGNEQMLLMELPMSAQKMRIEAALAYLDSYHSAKTAPASSSSSSDLARTNVKTINRKLRLFYASTDHLEERFELPDSFYQLTAAEVKLEAAARRKKLEDSHLLIPKSFREKQALAAKRRYKATVLRVQFPDGVVLQGFFGPRESTTALYEFVASTLKDSHETFDLVLPAAIKHRVIPRFMEANGQCLTLEEADLVPKALLKFKPTGAVGFTGLKNEMYDLCEPLTLTTLLDPIDCTSK